MSGVPSDETSLLDVLSAYEEAGYASQFVPTQNESIACQQCRSRFPAAMAEMRSLRRLEGASDPSDMLAVVALACPICQVRGTLVLGYGPESSKEDSEVLAVIQDGRTLDMRDQSGHSMLPASMAPAEAGVHHPPFRRSEQPFSDHPFSAADALDSLISDIAANFVNSGGERQLVSSGLLTSRIVDRLRDNPFTQDSNVQITVKDGVVSLSGSVPCFVAKNTMGDDAWSVLGVRDVSNQLIVQGGEARVVATAPSRVRDVMTPNPVTVLPEMSVVEAASLMKDYGIGDVIVVRGRRLEGMLTDRDIALRVVGAELDPVTTTVDSACTREVVCASPFDTIEGALALMSERAVRRLPVLERGELVGIVTLGDLVVASDPLSVLADICQSPSNNDRGAP